MLNIDNIFVKYINSSEKWILPVPVIEAGQVKLRCYMTRRDSLTGVFNDCYTYNVSFSTLADFFSYKSHGQAYNELIKFKKVRTGFLSEPDHIKGHFTISDIKETIINGKTALLLEAIQTIMNVQNRVFTMEAITELEKAQRKADKEKLAHLEAELKDMGYDY